MKKKLVIIIAPILLILLVGGGINIGVVKSTQKNFVASIRGSEVSFETDVSDLKKKGIECIIVPGAAVKPNGKPSKMLADRLDFAVQLYEMGVAPKLLLSGDNGQAEYNEVAAMQRYVLDKGVPKEDVFLDHAGFSTYETMYRAKDIFLVRTAIVVTQSYHLYRALYIGKELDLEVYGAASDQKKYGGQEMRELREVLARDKDFFKCIVKPAPTFLGEPFPISGDGQATWV